MSADRIVVAPPVQGYWAIYNPPGHPALAYDFLATDERKSLYRQGGFLRHLLGSIPVDDTWAWAQPVFSPVDGVVVDCFDSATDRREISFLCDLFSLLVNKPKVAEGFAAFGGNHVMIRAGCMFVLLCHLRQGSISVRKGDSVKAGHPVGEVGNSGSSIQPHLHMQVMSDDRYFPLFASLLPFRLSRGELRQDGVWTALKAFPLVNRGHYRFAAPAA